MTRQGPATAGLVLVTVAAGSRRVDLALPGWVPVAELVPDIAGSVGMLDAGTVHGGYRLLARDGRVLAGDLGLTSQGVEHGGLLTVDSGLAAPPKVYDDVVEAVADVVEQGLDPWHPAVGRRTALVAAAASVVLAALALLVEGDEVRGGVAAAVVAALLVAGGVAARNQGRVGVALVLLATPHAAVTGLLLAPGGLPARAWPPPDSFFAAPVACAGLGVLLVGAVAALGLREGRAMVVPAVVLGCLMVASGVTCVLVPVDPALVHVVVMTFLVLAGTVFPWLALGVTGTRTDQVVTVADITAAPGEVDAVRVAADVRRGHDLLLALAASVGAVLVLVAPLAVSRGISGTLLAVACCAAVMLRTRQHRTGREVLAGLLSGIAGLASVALSVLLVHESWRPVAALALGAGGLLLLAFTLVPTSPSVRRGRVGDVAETVTLLSLLPLMVVAAGVVTELGG
jgi:type VII secretion integral membrane protein EccD